MDSHQGDAGRENAEHDTVKVPATLGMMIGGFLLIAAIGIVLLWAL